MVTDDVVWVGGAVVEELSERLVCVPVAFFLRVGNVSKGDVHGRFDGAVIPEH